MIDLKKVAVHYAVSSLFEEYGERAGIYCYSVTKHDHQRKDAGKIQLAVGRAAVESTIIGEAEEVSYAVLHLGNHAFNGGVRVLGDEAYQAMKEEIFAVFERGDFADVIRMMDKHFGMNNYSLTDLFRDEQRKILNVVISSTLEEFANSYRAMYDSSLMLMGFLRETGMPLPKAFRTAAEFTLNHGLLKAFGGEKMEIDSVREIADDIKRWDVPMDSIDIEYAIRLRLEAMMDRLRMNPRRFLLEEFQATLTSAALHGFNFWQAEQLLPARPPWGFSAGEADDQTAAKWSRRSRAWGGFGFRSAAVLPEG
jgi:hypothetical protein